MFDLILVVIPVIGALVGLLVGMRTLRRRPHMIFSPFKKAEITIYNQSNEERIALLTAPIANEKKRYFGDTAKKVSAMVVYRAPTDDKRMGLNSAIGLPYIDSYGIRTRIVGQLKSKEDIRMALENHFFDRKGRDIPQGRGEHVVVAYGIEKVNKLFFASNPPIEIPLSPHKKVRPDFTACFLRLEIAGGNLPSTVSEGSMIMANSWNNFTFPRKITTIKTPSKVRNLLLHIGIGRNVRVLGSKSHPKD